MSTANQLIEELVSLTRGSLRNVETELAELRADVRVLSERMNNRHSEVGKMSESMKTLEGRVNDLEKAHAKYLGAAAVIGGVLGFGMSVAKGALGL
jgi:methyl-accepting chemotaxis protein